MLDSLSEKFLTYIINNQENNIVQNIYDKYDDIGICADFVTQICKSLEEQGYISVIYADMEVHTVILLHKGAIYFEYKKAVEREYIKHFLLSKISDVIVSFVVALITALIAA